MWAESGDDELPVLDEDVPDMCDVEVATDVESAADPANTTLIPAVAIPTARSGRTDTAISALPYIYVNMQVAQ